MDFKLTPEQVALKQTYDEFFREEMKKAPEAFLRKGLEASHDEGYAFTRYMRTKLVEKNWYVQHWPTEYGGRSAPLIDQLIFNESMGYYGVPGFDNFGVNMFGPTILLHGSEEQKKRILGPISRAEVQYCQGWSEPNAGSDLASLRTTAIKDGEYYIVNGQKTWTTMGHKADHMFLLARTDPKEKRGRGLSVFNVDLSWPGIEIRPINYMDNSIRYNEVWMTDLKIHESERIGAENQGWGITRDTMNFERSGVDNFSKLRRYLEQIVEYVKSTKRNGRYLFEDPLVRQKIGRIYAEMEAGRALAYRITWLQEKGNLRLSPALASESKVLGTEIAQRVADFALEIMGLPGNLEGSRWAPLHGHMISMYQSIIGHIICGGTNEIQRNIIAWVGCNMPRLKGQG